MKSVVCERSYAKTETNVPFTKNAVPSTSSEHDTTQTAASPGLFMKVNTITHWTSKSPFKCFAIKAHSSLSTSSR